MICTDCKQCIEYIDPSGLSTASRCPAKWLFSRQIGLKKPDAFVIALDFGTDIHFALPFCYAEDGLQKAIDAFTHRWNLRKHGQGDKKRNIFLLKPDYVHVVKDDMTSIMRYKKGSTQYVSGTLKKAENIRLYS